MQNDLQMEGILLKKRGDGTMKDRHPAYRWFMVIMAVMGLLGLTLLIWGSLTNASLPRVLPSVFVLGGALHG